MPRSKVVDCIRMLGGGHRSIYRDVWWFFFSINTLNNYMYNYKLWKSIVFFMIYLTIVCIIYPIDYRLPDKLCGGRRPSPSIFDGDSIPKFGFSRCLWHWVSSGKRLQKSMERSTIVNKGNSTNWMAEWPCSIAVAMLVITI